MDLILYSNSQSLIANLSEKLGQSLEIRNKLSDLSDNNHIHILHITSFSTEGISWIKRMGARGLKIAACSDRPDLGEMLACVQAGSKAYCNSYMQAGMYQQMIEYIAEGQSWFPPQMLEQTFLLAQSALGIKKNPASFSELTERENEVAKAVADGLSNRQIAERCDISERTVKAHLTNIFKKLDIKDRVALVLQFK
jgi:two-component system, NarL family, nitrate/nitrite response regulator NarL